MSHAIDSHGDALVSALKRTELQRRSSSIPGREMAHAPRRGSRLHPRRQRADAHQGPTDPEPARRGPRSSCLAIAKRFAAEGAHVFVTGRRKEVLDAALAAIDGEVTGVRADATSVDDLTALYALVHEQAGRIDVLVANAGGGSYAPLGQITQQQYWSTARRSSS
jgi:hypothetical protein